jgi:hypothetical protein
MIIYQIRRQIDMEEFRGEEVKVFIFMGDLTMRKFKALSRK